MTKCCNAEALRLLKEFVRCKDVRKLDDLVREARAFLANVDIPAAREAAYREALKDARLLCTNDHAYDNEHSQVFEAVQVINRALADPSPAAAALLAQGEERQALRSELLELVDGDDSTLADQIRDLILNLDEGVLAEARAALQDTVK